MAGGFAAGSVDRGDHRRRALPAARWVRLRSKAASYGGVRDRCHAIGHYRGVGGGTRWTFHDPRRLSHGNDCLRLGLSVSARGDRSAFQRHPDGPVFYGTKGCLKGNTIIFDDGRRQSAIELFEREADTAVKELFFPLGFTDPFAIQQYDWLQAIKQGGQPETDGDEGMRDLAAAFAIIESCKLRRAVTLDEVLTGAVDGYQAEINEHYGLL